MKYILTENKEYGSNLSRYQILRLIEVVDSDEKYLETYNQIVVPESDDDIFHAVSSSEEGRLDIISNYCYGTPTYWWMIALANNIIDPFNIPEGTLLRIPSLMTINDPANEILYKRNLFYRR